MTTKHTCGGPVFGRLTKGCPRCDELAAGSPPVTWGVKPRYDRDPTYKKFLARYCFSHNTPLAANRCDTCGKPPYTD